MQEIFPEANLDKYYLYPGKIFSSKKPHVVDTILGSCVAVFLWDTSLQIGSINHYMLPLWNKENAPSFKYGDIAISELITRMKMMGSNKKNVIAKLFGGSEISNSNGTFNIGKRNIIVAQDVLKSEQIPIVSYSVGGSMGRKVIFYSGSGDVLISYIKQDLSDSEQQGSNSKIKLSA